MNLDNSKSYQRILPELFEGWGLSLPRKRLILKLLWIKIQIQEVLM